MGELNNTSPEQLHSRAAWWRRLACFFLSLLMLLSCFPTAAFAAWDGSGSSGDRKIILDKCEQLFYNVTTIIFRHILA